MNPHTNRATQENSEKICDFLNQRFGYRMALEAALAAQGIGLEMVSTMIVLARDRKIDSFDEMLKIHSKPTT